MKAALLLTLLATAALAAEAPIRLWPGAAPGETGGIGEEKDMSKPGDKPIAGRPIIRLGNVTDPTITLYRPPAEKDTGAAVLVCPGGGYHILAWDLEGTEVCEWLNSIGVTGILLKYRVPARKDRERHAAPLQDAQRAMAIIRSRSAEWGLDPARTGILGFSAGGHLAAITCATAAHTYPAVDAADATPARPAFAILIYPGYLTRKDKPDTLTPGLDITAATPPTFIAMTQDDPVMVEGALFYSLALKNAKVPCELHIYPDGGHGYGLRRTEKTVTTWPDRAADWMKASGFLRAK